MVTFDSRDHLYLYCSNSWSGP